MGRNMSNPLYVLYVEDDPDIRTVAEFALEGEDFELMICHSGQEALQRATGWTPDLLLLDVMMPGMDGPTTLRKLRELPHLATTPAIFMTAKVQPAEVAQYRAMGALGVIGKPFDPMKLAGEIRRQMRPTHDGE
jgi:CheY-like chemotaxis protein